MALRLSLLVALPEIAVMLLRTFVGDRQMPHRRILQVISRKNPPTHLTCLGHITKKKFLTTFITMRHRVMDPTVMVRTVVQEVSLSYAMSRPDETLVSNEHLRFLRPKEELPRTSSSSCNLSQVPAYGRLTFIAMCR